MHPKSPGRSQPTRYFATNGTACAASAWGSEAAIARKSHRTSRSSWTAGRITRSGIGPPQRGSGSQDVPRTLGYWLDPLGGNTFRSASSKMVVTPGAHARRQTGELAYSHPTGPAMKGGTKPHQHSMDAASEPAGARLGLSHGQRTRQG